VRGYRILLASLLPLSLGVCASKKLRFGDQPHFNHASPQPAFNQGAKAYSSILTSKRFPQAPRLIHHLHDLVLFKAAKHIIITESFGRAAVPMPLKDMVPIRCFSSWTSEYKTKRIDPAQRICHVSVERETTVRPDRILAYVPPHLCVIISEPV